MITKCWLCDAMVAQRPVYLRSKKPSIINYCDHCKFEFFDHDNSNLLSGDKLDKTRLEAAGLDIPKMEKDFENGYAQSAVYIEEYLDESDIGSNILEIGCSWGYFLKRLKEYGANPYGVEVNSVRANYVNEELNICCYTDINSVVKSGIKFKKIFLFYCLEYIKDPVKYFENLLQCLDSYGDLILITPNLDDVLKDVWMNEGYKNFFYDECAIAYYSLRAVDVLMSAVNDDSGSIKHEIVTKQGYSIYNHLHWFYNGRPVNNNTLVGGDQISDKVCDSLSSVNQAISNNIKTLIHEFDKKYKTLIESNHIGNQIIATITKLA